MTEQIPDQDYPSLNYFAVTGIVKRRKGINLTRQGIPVIHLFVENVAETWPGSGKTVKTEFQIDLWGNATSFLDSKLKVGSVILAEGRLAHKKTEDHTGGVHYHTVLHASRIEVIS
ncbi:hypothetical protein CSA37_09680 [Candidatus Fermentibacteria bacterium]|nr:MAG: hypothetical protein CSA37_09680 [Candidatus Fermentibacteria bacterium]